MKKTDDMLSRFHLIPERYGRTDGQTDRFAISVSRVSMLTRDKKISGNFGYMGEIPPPCAILTKCGMRADMMQIITCALFGVGVVRG